MILALSRIKDLQSNPQKANRYLANLLESSQPLQINRVRDDRASWFILLMFCVYTSSKNIVKKNVWPLVKYLVYQNCNVANKSLEFSQTLKLINLPVNTVLPASKITSRFKTSRWSGVWKRYYNFRSLQSQRYLPSEKNPWRETHSNFSYFSALISPEPITLCNNS